MFLETVDRVEVGKISGRRNVQWVKDEDTLSHELNALIILLHKYSSHLQDEVFLRIHPTTADQKIELHFSPTGDQTFNSLMKAVQKDMRVFDHSPLKSLDIEWIIDEDKTGLKHRIRLTLSAKNFCDVVFSSDPHSLYHAAFRRASGHYKTLIENAIAFPRIPIA